MGLDAVEFVIALETAFNVVIPDAEAATLRTPGQVVNCLAARLPSAPHRTCLEQRAFYQLRRATVEVLGLPRAACRPDVPWKDLLPPGARKQKWREVRAVVGTAKWPPMWFGHVPGYPQTIGGTARYLAVCEPGAFRRPSEGWARADLEQGVRGLMAEELGITEFTWDQDFVRDLGVD